MKIKVKCPSCGRIKNTTLGNKYFRCCHLEFPVDSNLYQNEKSLVRTNTELEEEAKRIADIVIEKIYNTELGSLILAHKTEVFTRKK